MMPRLVHSARFKTLLPALSSRRTRAPAIRMGQNCLRRMNDGDGSVTNECVHSKDVLVICEKIIHTYSIKEDHGSGYKRGNLMSFDYI